MRIRYLWIENYKTLKNFRMYFTNEHFLEVVAGKNGTGKSSLFEAIALIFHHLYQDNSEEGAISFEYEIEYEINGIAYNIKYDFECFYLNNYPVEEIDKAYLPDAILIYYSGHSETIKNISSHYKEDLSELDYSLENQKFGFISNYILDIYAIKNIIINLSLILDEETGSSKKIKEFAGIKNISDNLKMSLPCLDKFNDVVEFNISEYDKLLIKKMNNIALQSNTRLNVMNALTLATYSVEKLKQEVFNSEFNRLEFINFLIKLYAMDSLDVFDVEYIGVDDLYGHDIELSDGENQAVIFSAAIDILKDKNILMLIDEPDAFLHTDWQYNLFKQFNELDVPSTSSTQCIVSTHSPISLINCNIEYIHMLSKNSAGIVSVSKTSKNNAINEIGSHLISFSERKNLIDIINNDSTPVLFVEGYTDLFALNVAWNALFCGADMPFRLHVAFSDRNMNQLLCSDFLGSSLSEKTGFGLFDFDSAYDQWKGIGDIIERDPYKGMITKRKNKEIYGILMPVPNREKIVSQVIKDRATLETFGGKSICAMEHVFYGHPETLPYFTEIPLPGGGVAVSFFQNKKKQFATEVIPALPAHYFEPFRSVFLFIKSHC